MKRVTLVVGGFLSGVAAVLVIQRPSVADWFSQRWADLDKTQGFVVGALVALIGVLINNALLLRVESNRHERAREIENDRHVRAQETAATDWERQLEKTTAETRRDLYGRYLSRVHQAWFVHRMGDKRSEAKNELSNYIAATLAEIRLSSDSQEVIQAARLFGIAALKLTRSYDASTRTKFNEARQEFVQQARRELGRAELPPPPPITEGVVDSDLGLGPEKPADIPFG